MPYLASVLVEKVKAPTEGEPTLSTPSPRGPRPRRAAPALTAVACG